MQNPSIKVLLIAFLLTGFLARAPFVTAVSVEEFAGFYANPGESVSVAEFSSDNKSFYMVKLNGAEAIVLEKSGELFDAVASESDLKPIVKAYLLTQFDSIGFADKAAVIKNSFASFANTTSGCIEAIITFIPRTRLQMPFMYITLAAATTFKKEYIATQSLNSSLPEFSAVFNGIGNKTALLDSAVAEKNTDECVNALKAINSDATRLKTIYANVSAAHAAIISPNFPTAFYVKGEKRSCDYDANTSAGVEAIISASTLGAIKPSSELVTQIAKKTGERHQGALNKWTASILDKKLANYSLIVAALSNKYKEVASAYGTEISLSALSSKYAELNTIRNLVKNASATTNVSTYAKEFDKKAVELENLINSYNTTLKEYKESLSTVANASQSLQNAIKRFGTNDDRILAMQKELQELKLFLKANEDKLKNGLFAALAFQNIQGNASALNLKASTLAPKEWQLDFTVIGGVLLLVGSVIGVIWFYRKRKPPREMPYAALPPEQPQPAQPTAPPS